jgi:hypothetical protein
MKSPEEDHAGFAAGGRLVGDVEWFYNTLQSEVLEKSRAVFTTATPLIRAWKKAGAGAQARAVQVHGHGGALLAMGACRMQQASMLLLGRVRGKTCIIPIR